MTAGRGSAWTFALVGAVVVAGLVAVTLAYTSTRGSPTGTTSTGCGLPAETGPSRVRLPTAQFGAVTEYALPMTSRWSNAVTVSSDGSVWFGEQAVPGVAHLLLNGTLVEYPWPTAREPRTGCGYRTGIWGIQVWNGLVWAADSDENALVGVDPATGGATVVNVTGDAPQPYTLAASPDGSLWFTTLSQNAVLGRLMPNLTAVAYQVNGLGGEVPLQVEFVNSSYAYFVALNPIRPYGHLYAFDPEVSGRSITPVRVGGAFQILDPSSVSATGGHVWVTQHGASDLAEFDVKSGNWTVFPTSTENFTTTTLPYFVYAGGQEVWFNEHYANRIAVLNASAGTLTEFSEADPPIENGSLIQNDLTIAPGDGGLWFTSITGNYVGFVNGSVRIPLSISVRGADSIALAPGQTAKMDFLVGGVGRDGAKVGTSDSEAYDSVPNMITMAPSMTVIPPSSGPQVLQVAVTPRVGTAPGTYTMAVSVSDGLVIQTAYFFLRVS